MVSRRTLVQWLSIAMAATTLPLSGCSGEQGNSQTANQKLQTQLVEGPIHGGERGWIFGRTTYDLEKFGYVEEEYFVSGVARRYEPVNDLGPDGNWIVRPLSSAPYKTRIVVRRPRDPKKFNGTAIIEWSNVSGGRDSSLIDFPVLYSGFAYVSILTQRVGIHGYPANPQGLHQWDPSRYSSLSIPDDGLSYDIFTQIARIFGAKGRESRIGPDPLGGADLRKTIAIGASQSGTRLLTYINAIQMRENVFDAIMPLICAGSAADFAAERAHPDPGNGEKKGLKRHSRHIRSTVRSDISIPIMEINSETEASYYYSMRQPDTDKFRYWEIAGASHAPKEMIEAEAKKSLRDERDTENSFLHSSPKVQPSAVSWRPTTEAAILHVHKWLNDGIAPPKQPRINISETDHSIERDKYGNAIGGIRLPELEVPIARYNGFHPERDILGVTDPFPDQQLLSLYPTHDEYLEKITKAANDAVSAGVILPNRAREYILEAKAAIAKRR